MGANVVVSIGCHVQTCSHVQRVDSCTYTRPGFARIHTLNARHTLGAREKFARSTRATKCKATPLIYYQRQDSQANGSAHVADRSVSVVFLAGGTGKRMGASMPKQYLQLLGQPIAMHSLNTFGGMREVGEVIVVCDPSYRDLFMQYLTRLPPEVKHSFALPGIERQDSVYNGLQAVSSKSELVAVHDSARPLLQAEDAAACMLDAQQTGAAVLGVPVKPTIKEVDSSGMVVKTLVRACLWEVQTPQVIRPELLQQGFQLVQKHKLEVTDDVSIIEAMGKPVKITKGSYTNIKVTTPDDMLVAEGFLMSKDSEYSVAGNAGATSVDPFLAAVPSASV